MVFFTGAGFYPIYSPIDITSNLEYYVFATFLLVLILKQVSKKVSTFPVNGHIQPANGQFLAPNGQNLAANGQQVHPGWKMVGLNGLHAQQTVVIKNKTGIFM
ncbi:hypothetical protein [Thermincola potens]|uniref:hypothetical protein n=1 Tax=Thermincola potens TaxID=863643 RepID=UPI00059F6F88|nr:hypothetical protein [Thermincola potens]